MFVLGLVVGVVVGVVVCGALWFWAAKRRKEALQAAVERAAALNVDTELRRLLEEAGGKL